MAGGSYVEPVGDPILAGLRTLSAPSWGYLPGNEQGSRNYGIELPELPHTVFEEELPKSLIAVT